MRIPSFVGKPAFDIFSIAFAIINRCILVHYASSIGKDKRMHLSMAENLLDGRGLGLTKYYFNDVYTPVFDQSQPFPPGYSLLIAPFLKIFKNEYVATTILDIIVAIAFILTIRWCCKKIGFKPATVNLITIITGCFQYNFFLNSTPTDAINLTLLFAGIGMAISLATVDSKTISARQIMFSAFLFFLPGFFRYLSVPIGLLLPMLLVAIGYLRKDRLLLKKSLLVFLITAILTAGLFVFLFQYAGSAPPTYHTKPGFYPENLVRWYPFLPATFINLGFAAQQVERVSAYTYLEAFIAFEILNAVLFLVFCLLFVIWYRRYCLTSVQSGPGIFIYFGVAISMLILGVLMFLASRWAPKPGPISATLLSVDRYFSFINIFIQVVLIAWVTGDAFKSYNRILKFLAIAGVIILGVEILHGIYYNAKIVFFSNGMSIKQTIHRDYEYLDKLCDSLSNQNRQHRILVTSHDKVYPQLAIKAGYTGVFDIENIDKAPIRLKEKALLVLPISQWDLWKMKDYLETHKSELAATVSGTRFYILELSPQ